MGFLSVIRRWALRDKMPIREIARRTGLSRNTIRKYLREGATEPKFKASICHRSDVSWTRQDIKEIRDRLNNTPRKCRGWKTPAKVFREKMLEEMR